MDECNTAIIEAVPVWQGDIVSAYEAALKECTPQFVAATAFVDDRGWSIMNQLQGVMAPAGQINFSLMYPLVIKAWHRHQKQTDFWLCVSGHIRVGVHRDDGRTWQLITGQMCPGVMVVPPPLWHGASTVGDQPAGLLYYVTQAYDPASPDEERRPFDSVPGFSWSVDHR